MNEKNKPVKPEELLHVLFEDIKENIPEIVLILGLFFIICGFFLIHFIAGMFSIGIILVILAIFLAKKPHKRR